jgi:hypothetical protein
MTLHPGRFSARLDGDFVVFMIGMRVNRPQQVRKWLPVFVAMPRMLRELAKDPDSGFLHATQGFATTGPFWHETYRVRAGEYETIYGNMPRIGLAAAGDHTPIGSTSTAAQRVGARPDDVAPVAGY